MVHQHDVRHVGLRQKAVIDLEAPEAAVQKAPDCHDQVDHGGVGGAGGPLEVEALDEDPDYGEEQGRKEDDDQDQKPEGKSIDDEGLSRGAHEVRHHDGGDDARCHGEDVAPVLELGAASVVADGPERNHGHEEQKVDQENGVARVGGFGEPVDLAAALLVDRVADMEDPDKHEDYRGSQADSQVAQNQRHREGIAQAA